MFHNQKSLKISVLLYCCMQMSMLGISAVTAEMTRHFTECSRAQIQFIATFPDMMIVIVSLICGKCINYVGKRKMINLSGVLFLVTAVGGILFHDSYTVLLLWSGALGSAIGILIPTAVAVINDEVEEAYKTAALGLQNAAIGFGGIAIILLSGVLSSKKWYFCYFVYLLAIPSVWGLNKSLKTDCGKEKTIHKKETIRWKYAIGFSFIAFLFFLLYNALSANAAFLLEELRIISTVKNSVVIGALMLGSALAGFGFDELFSLFRFNTLYVGICLLCLGIWYIYLFPIFWIVCIGMIISGSSLALVMATLTAVILQQCKGYSANLTVAIVMAFSDFGGFFSPLYTELAHRMLKEHATVLNNYALLSVFMLVVGIGIYLGRKVS